MRRQLEQLGLLLGVLTGSIIFLSSPASAVSVNWVSSEPTYDGVVEAPAYKPQCESGKMMVDGLMQRTRAPYEASVCYRDHGVWGYGNYSYYQNVFNRGYGYAIRFEPGSVLYRITTDLSSNGGVQLIDVPNSNDVIRKSRDNFWYYRDFTSKFQRSTNVALSRMYDFDRDGFDFQLRRPDGTVIKSHGLAISNNGRWAVAEARGVGLVRIDLKTYEIKRFSTINIDYGISRWPGPRADMAVSNDGQNAVIAGWNSGVYKVFDIKNDCGDAMRVDTSTDTPIEKKCSSRNLRELVYSNYPVRQEFIYSPKFSDDGGKLLLHLGSVNSSSSPPREWVQFTAGDYVPFEGLPYLALGDSYSSGEGDTERIGSSNDKWYREWTDVKGSSGEPEERCHISKRSYPYKLAAGMNMDLNSDWQTVACSGAEVWDAKGQGSSDYSGQQGRLEGFDLPSFKEQALNEFIPGRVKQIEFVKKYKPKVITLTMGGNDVGFGDKIDKCVRSPRTCDIAKEGERPKLKKEILDQFDNLSSLYSEIAEASNYQSKIFVLGYPQFVSGEKDVSCDSIFFLRPNERKMVYESVRYINRVIKAAADASGVVYVDIEGSLDNKKICEGKDLYVTAITGIWGYRGNQVQESFHPNAKGHQAIASTVVGKLGTNDLRTYDFCSDGSKICQNSDITNEDVEDTDYFAVESASAIIKNTDLAKKNQQKSGWVSVVLDAFSFSARTMVGITLHSDPIDLGSFTAGADGSLSTTIQIPAGVEVGYHRIVVTGKTTSGEDIEYYQYIFVQGDNPEDLNDNGIKDSGETCAFLFPDTEYSNNSGLRRECDLAQSDRNLNAGKTSPWSPDSGTPIYMRPASYSNLRESNDPGETLLNISSLPEDGVDREDSPQTKDISGTQADEVRQEGTEPEEREVYVVVALTVIIFVSTFVVKYKFIRRK